MSINAAASQKIDDSGGADANVGYQLLHEPPIVLYLVHARHSVLLKLEIVLSASLSARAGPFRSGQN